MLVPLPALRGALTWKEISCRVSDTYLFGIYLATLPVAIFLISGIYNAVYSLLKVVGRFGRNMSPLSSVFFLGLCFDAEYGGDLFF
jgi:hypothetical protein